MFKKSIIVQFNRYIKSRFFCSKSSTKEKLYNVLLTNLPVVSKDVDELFNLYSERLFKIPEKRIIKNTQLCKEYNIELKTARNMFSCFLIDSYLLKHRIFFLQELGVPRISINLIWKLAHCMKKSAIEFKRITNIPSEQHVMSNMIYHIDKNLSDIQKLDELYPMTDHYQACFLYYAQHKLGFNNDKPLKYRGVKYKSIRLMTMLTDFYRDNFDFDLEYIRNHLYIFDVCQDYAQYVLNNLKDYKISDYTFQQVVKKWHKILKYDPENTKKLLLTLKNYELDGKPLKNCIKILKVDNDYLIDKLNEISTIPDLKVWCKSPRVLYFIVHKDMINERIELLRKKNYIKSANSYLITSERYYFKKFQQDELNFTKKSKYIRYIFCKELGSDTTHLINNFKKHSNWDKVSFVDLDNTLNTIKKYYSIEDICRNIQIILYPWSIINKTLQTIKESNVYSKEYTPSQQLALCMYLMEKDNHFTGDGIWNIEEKNQLTSDKKMESLDTNESLDSNKI